jgi:hypothetical protein
MTRRASPTADTLPAPAEGVAAPDMEVVRE